MSHELASGLVLLAASGLVTLLSLPALLPVLRSLAVDEPTERSSHVAPTPRGGGLAVILGVMAAFVLAAEMSYASIPSSIVVALLGLGVVGFVDDIRSLGAAPRLLAQVVCALVAVATAASDFDLDVVGVTLSLFLVVGSVNAFNFMDGINGISGMVSVVAGLWFLFVGASSGSFEVALLGSVTAGAGLGFLPWNLKGVVFLGDAGSYFLGGVLGTCCLWLVASGTDALLAVAPLVPYIADTAWTLTRRTLAGAPIGTPHRDHAYQRLARQGLGHNAAALSVALWVSLCCVSAKLFSENAALVLATWSAICVFYLASPRLSSPMIVRRR